MFGPAFVQSLRGIKSRTKSYNVIYNIAKPLYPFMKKFPKKYTNTTDLANTMIYVALDVYSKNVVENADINYLVSS